MEAKKVFIAYAPTDKPFLEKLTIHLNAMEKQGLISAWSDEEILAGEDYLKATEVQMESAQIILLLVSSDFLASDFCADRILIPALQKHAQGKTLLVPIIVRYCDWYAMPFAKVKVLPLQDGQVLPVKDWTDPDKAYYYISQELRKIIQPKTENSHPTITAHTTETKTTSPQTTYSNRRLWFIGMAILTLGFLLATVFSKWITTQQEPNKKEDTVNTVSAKIDTPLQAKKDDELKPDANIVKTPVNPPPDKTTTSTAKKTEPKPKKTLPSSTTTPAKTTTTPITETPTVAQPQTVSIELSVNSPLQRTTVWIDDKEFPANPNSKSGTISVQNVPIGTHRVSLDKKKPNCTKTITIEKTNPIFKQFSLCF